MNLCLFMRYIQIFISVIALFLPTFAQAQEHGTLITIAGGGTEEGENIPATDVGLNFPLGISLDIQGNIYIADTENHRVRRVDIVTGNITTVAGTGGDGGFAGDGGPAAQAQLNRPTAVAVADDGTVYIGDSGNHRIRRVDLTGIITTIAGTGESGFAGDGGPATQATFGEITALLVGGGILFISDGIGTSPPSNNRVRQLVLSSSIISTVAGSGSATATGIQDGGSASLAGLTPEQLAFGPAPDFNLHVADFNNGRIRSIFRTSDTTSAITTVAGRPPTSAEQLQANIGTFDALFKGDGGPASQALFNGPAGVVLDIDGNIYIADTGNHRIRVVEASSGNVFTLAGTGIPGTGDENVLGLLSDLGSPSRVLVDANGDLLFIDTGNNRIRKMFNARYRTPLFSTITTRIDFSRVSFGDPASQTLTVQNSGNLPANILASTSNNPAFQIITPLPLEIGASQTAQLEVVFNPLNEGVADGLITITTDDPRTPTATFTLTGIGEVPQVTLFPSDLITFDRTFIGQSTTASVRIANVGAGTLVILRATSPDTQFVAPLTEPLRINSGQSQNLNITFRPTAEDTQKTVLTIFTNAPRDTAITINLQGIGQQAEPGGFLNVSADLALGDTGAGFGASWADVDNDNDPDLYLVRSFQANRLYRNDGSTFTEMATTLGIGDSGDGSSGIWGDIDRDGDLDLYITNFGQPNRYYRNDGNTFTEMAASLGIDDSGDGHGAAWADVDRDGDLDLYVANFGTNHFYRNDGNTFTEYTDSLGLTDTQSSIQPAFADYDNDGDADLFLANSGPDKLLRNDGGTFTLVSNLLSPPDTGPSFGATWGDYENDGDLDLLVTQFNAPNRFYINDNNIFQDSALNTSLLEVDRSRGAAWGDFDNDGFLDLYITNSGQPNRYYRNIASSGFRIFTEEADTLGLALNADSRGLAIADYDGDGGLDLYVAVQNGADALLKNQEANGNWIFIHPIATETGIDVIGLRVEFSYKNEAGKAIREIGGGSSYLSQNARNILIGVNDAEELDLLTLRWPSGIVQQFIGSVDNLRVNQTLTITEEPPLPPTQIVLETNTANLLANGVSEAVLTATIVDTENKRVLVNDRAVQFRIETGDGIFIGSDSIAVRDGLASTRYRASQTPGRVTFIAQSPGLIDGRVDIQLLKPLGNEALTIRTIAGTGNGGFNGDGGLATEASLQLPSDVHTDAQGNVYIVDTGSNRIRLITLETGIIQTHTGTGPRSSEGDGGPSSEAALAEPQGLTIFSNSLFISEAGGQRVRRVQNDTITTFAGTGVAQFSGDNGPATNANVSRPVGLATDTQGNLYIADSFNRRVRKVTPNGIITTIAGSGTPDIDGFSGDGGLATFARLSRVSAVAVDSIGRVFIADTQNHRIRMINTNGIIITIVGTGNSGFNGDGGPGTQAEINSPQGLAVDNQGNLFITDTGNQRIRLFNLNTGIIQTVAGTGLNQLDVEEGNALDVSLNNPQGLDITPTGTVLIADRSNHRIMELSIQFDLPNLFNPQEKSADFNADGKLDFADFLLFVNAFGNADDRFDLNSDGLINLNDLILFATAFETNQTIVRP